MSNRLDRTLGSCLESQSDIAGPSSSSVRLNRPL